MIQFVVELDFLEWTTTASARVAAQERNHLMALSPCLPRQRDASSAVSHCWLILFSKLTGDLFIFNGLPSLKTTLGIFIDVKRIFIQATYRTTQMTVRYAFVWRHLDPKVSSNTKDYFKYGKIQYPPLFACSVHLAVRQYTS